MSGEDFGCLGEVITSLERDFVRLNQFRVLFELGINPIQSWIERPVVQPVKDAEREKVLAAIDLLTRKLHVSFQSVSVQGRDRQLMHPIAGQRAILERVRFVRSMLEIV